MRTWQKPLLISIAVALAIWSLIAKRQAPQPSYQGKPLEYWITLYFDTPSGSPWASPRQRAVATDAIRHMGTNALPFLLRWVSYDDSFRRRTYEQLPARIARLTTVYEWYQRNPNERRALQAGKALISLGPDASPTFPGLSRLLNETNTSSCFHRSMWILAGIGKPAALVLAHEAASKTNPNRLWIIWGLAGVGTNATPAIPTLTGMLDDPDPLIRQSAAETLRQITNVTINPFE